MRTHILILALLVAVAFLIGGCGGGSSSSGSTSRVKVLVGDAPIHLEDGTQVSAVNVSVSRVELLREADDETSRVLLFDASGSPAQIDLLQLANQSLTALPNLGTVSIPAGHYTQMRVILASGNTVTVAGDTQPHPLTVASGQETGFKVPVDMDLGSGTFESILLDFNLSRLIQQGNEFHLTPQALRVVKLSQTGAVTGTVSTPADFQLTSDVQVQITLVDASGNAILDASGNAIKTEISIASTANPATATYTLNGLPTGSYFLRADVTYGTQSIALPDIPVTITSGQTTTQDIAVVGLQ